MQFLKADTTVKVVVGPFVDATDGKTPEAGITLGAADAAELIKHDAAAVTDISGNTFAAITNADGYYNLTLLDTQLTDEGLMSVVITDTSECLPVKAEFMVMNANAYDSFYAAATTDYLDVNALQWAGAATATNDVALVQAPTNFANLGIDSDGSISAVTLCDTVATLTGHTAQTGDSFLRIGATGSGLTSLASQASITALNDVAATDIVSGGAITTSGGAVSTVTNTATVGSLAPPTNWNNLSIATDGSVTAGSLSFGTDDITAAAMSAAACNKIADHMLRRSYNSARTGSDGDTVARYSLLGAVARLTNKNDMSSGNSLVTYHEDGTTFFTLTATASATANALTVLE